MITQAPTRILTADELERRNGKAVPQVDIDRIVYTALWEDLQGHFDITSQSVVDRQKLVRAEIVLKEPAVIAGIEVISQVFSAVDSRLQFTQLHYDGTRFDRVPVRIASVSGSARAILTAERTALNILQRLCGVATVTRQYTELARPYGIEILDTRKTTPGLRALEKYAVAVAGGTNHRFGLFDAILIKDNHVRLAGGVTQAVEASRQNMPDKPVEVEVCNLSEVSEAVAVKAERILLDNMTPDQVRQSVAEIGGRAYVEVSGGINLSNIKDYLITGVNGISIGALTHSAKSIDISLEVDG